MNDKVATMTTPPISTPAKDAPASRPGAHPGKSEDNKQPVSKPAIKS